ncbi:KLC1 [Branchiostoma lanceolatum]|uniref:KLC1 protein n=1 Tax=Branchiostoma lanceolatum TaxID=7740 RepID=A0A8K0A6L8_BRALA|nr:KLC1 [Branchiostoma lanceolatum]
MTSGKADVMTGVSGHQFELPSALIARQTAKAATPDYSSYEEHLTKGDRALTDGKLDLAEREFASALKLIHDPRKPDQCKEAECLCRLGDVYAQRGKRTKEGRKFTQAAALYNAAMARSVDGNGAKLTDRLRETEQSFLQFTANIHKERSSYDRVLRHKKRLEDMRARAKSQLQAIDQQHNPYQYDEDDPAMVTVEAERAQAVKVLFKSIAKDRQVFIKDLVDECIATLGPPPCRYAFIGLGSQATELVTPYSDLEFAILIEEGKDNDDTRRYFLYLTHYLNLKVINLGETILPAMAIPSLNDFQSEDPEKDWFFDSVTPRGFAFDGFMPWACKTPFGREKTKTKPSVSLIQTPAKMAEFQQLEISLSEGYHLSDVLRRCVLLTGEESLVTEYLAKIRETITDVLLSHSRSRLSAIQLLWENKDQILTHEPTGQLINVKKEMYRFPSLAIEILALCCQTTHASTWSIIDELKQTQRIHDENATHLTVLTSISAELRLRTYVANGGQQDSLSPLAETTYQREANNTAQPDIAASLHNLGTSWGKLGDHRRAISYIEQSLTMKKAIYGSNTAHPSIAASLHSLGSSWSKFGDQRKAISYYERSLTIRKTIYGDNTMHPDIAMSLNNLGSAWEGLGEYKKAISYHEQSLKTLKTIYGDNTAHPGIATSLNNLGSAWGKLGDDKKAITYFEQSLKMRKIIYGDNMAHPGTAVSLINLGTSWSSLGDQRRAISYFEQSLTMTKTIYGESRARPDIAALLHSLGTSWWKLGDPKKAIRYFEHALEMRKTIYGNNMAHPEIAALLNNLHFAWSSLGNQQKAMKYKEQS